jgi:tetratricopeptide (TPR) repeat protein
LNKSSLAITFLIVALFIYASLSGDSALWGFNLLKFYPGWVRISALVLVIVTLIISSIKPKEHNETSVKRIGFWLPITIASLLVVSFFAFPSVTTFLGDGHLRTNQLRFGQLFLAPEPLDFLIHAGLFRFILGPLGYQPIVTYQLISAIAGAVFLIGIWRLAKALTGASELIAPKVFTLILLISSGALVLFFGYVESYSILLALLPFVITSAIHLLDGHSHWSRFVALFLLISFTHTLGAVLLTPLAVFVLVCAQRENFVARARKTSSALTFLLGGGLVLLVAFATFGIANVDMYVLRLLPETDSTPALLTTRHWTNLANWSLLAALPVFPLLPNVFKRLRQDVIWDDRRALIGLWLAIPALVFFVFFIPQLTGPRDWDLFAIPAYTLIVAAVLLSSRPERPFPIRSILAPIAISWALIAAFVGINHSLARSTDRFVDILEYTNERNLFKEYNLLSAYAKNHPSIARRRFEFLQKAWEQPPYLERDSVLVLNKLGEEHMKRGEYSLSEERLQLSLNIDNSNLYTYHFLANLYRASSAPQGIKKLAEYMSEALRTNARGLMDAGKLFSEVGEMAEAELCLTRAFTLDSADIFIVVNLGVYYLRTNDLQAARTLLEKATLIKPNYYTARYNLTLTYLRLSDWSAARKSLAKANALARTPQEKQQVQKLQGAFRERR